MATTQMVAALECIDLAASFDGREVFHGISFCVHPGETLGIMGPSGVGKSTLFRCLTLLHRPTNGTMRLEGQAYFDGKHIKYRPEEVRRNIGLVFQDLNLFPSYSAKENITLGLQVVGQLPVDERDGRAEDLMEILGIWELRDRYPHQLSGGQAQRVAVARALAAAPRVLLLDEAMAHIDEVAVERVRELISTVRGLAEETQMAIVLATHSPELLASFSDRVLQMSTTGLRPD